MAVTSSPGCGTQPCDGGLIQNRIEALWRTAMVTEEKGRRRRGKELKQPAAAGPDTQCGCRARAPADRPNERPPKKRGRLCDGIVPMRASVTEPDIEMKEPPAEATWFC